MKKRLDKKVSTIISTIETMCGKSSDFKNRTIQVKGKDVGILFFESVSSDDKISDFLIRSITTDIRMKTFRLFDHVFERLQNTITNSNMSTVEDYEDLFYHLASGFTCVVVDGKATAIVFETRSSLDRGVSEATTEAIIRGPKDSFTENHQTNLGLVRKRIKDEHLRFEDIIVGRRTKTKVTITYIDDIAELDRIDQIKKKLNEIDVDGILDSGYIREFLIGKQNSAFPKMISTERPDLVCGSILDGKIAILVENTPFALVMPGTLLDFFHTPEDYYQKPINISFTRILRILAFLLTLLMPALYIAITTFNQETIPDKLLISLATQRQGVPFPTAVEILILGITFEILRESDIRIPNIMGTAISVVGALVLGDAAVAAGIVSPIVVIIVAITSICGLLFSDIDMINAIRWWRFLFILMSILMGLVGFVIAGFIFVIKLASLESLGVSYLSPLSPFRIREQKDAIIRANRKKMIYRPEEYASKNPKRMGGIPK